ncbi:class I SAM-dependent DNA methyltransferase [Lujinxingia vulgaris]|uniref:site-specific DNA-methyltransferase (adenine-specific) n=1 Tax=Lujinxingia vulgaris TaxID=2600176 RepID=A0A5C6WWH4_9DELT|nr:class I SAM-dependent DNA methyltransferase [Lujinxingia vulgaris]TXD33786.1 class I SAM-dependent DNA methyltransferase [Lujinxingia vulgaris]
MNFTGIDNDTEFYSHHYLDAVLQSDLNSEVFKDWSDDDGTRPHDALRRLAREYFELRAELESMDDAEERRQRHATFLTRLLFDLGYEPLERTREVEELSITTLTEVSRQDGAPVLWALHAPYDAQAPDLDALSRYEDHINAILFEREEPPRFILLCSELDITLIDRTKWREKRYLRFDLDEILGRKDTDTLKVTAALLERRQIWSEQDQSLLDTLDESSHKHAFGVSQDLKYALREAIELLGNEAVYYIENVKKKKRYEIGLADELSRECLRFMYRILFLFYIEARPELGYAPMNNDAYLKGYSLESLRELEQVDLSTPESLNGYYLHESIKLLFDMIFNGTAQTGQTDLYDLGNPDGEQAPTAVHGLFTLSPLRTHLFDPKATPILSGVRLRNHVVQRIIELMSLSHETKGSGRASNKRRGRISYAQLGINQLGAVYEALLSYRGFFAETDLYEVKRANVDFDELHTAYFVQKDDLEKYSSNEIVKDEKGNFVVHPKGSFIYRLAGRDREKSASYYTPEVLTSCLVKYALKELLEGVTSADEILALTVCEPAMGSAAFLNEAVNQLAEAYLQRKQEELGRDIPHDRYLSEKQRIKTLIADRNVYGVDLNPIAVELAEVSLWLNTIHEGGFVPWFGTQLRCGNSLVGARHQKVPVSERGEPVYHFLLGDEGMAKYDDHIIKGKGGKNPIEGLATDAHEHFKTWRKAFNARLTRDNLENLHELTEAIDRLWARHVEKMHDIRERTIDPIDVWPHADADPHSPTTTAYKDTVLHQELYSEKVRASSPYRRLKMAMDYWCALWFWPNEHAELIPDRETFYWDLNLILQADILPSHRADDQTDLFAPTQPVEEARRELEEYGFVNLNELINRSDDIGRRLTLVQELASRYRFHHWELEFADIFEERGGFDLVLGNPPWLKVEWDEGGVLGDHDPYFVIKKLTASQTNIVRQETIERLQIRSEFLTAYEEATGTQNFLNAAANYPELKGIQTNLYKCFIPTGWRIGNECGVVGFLHPEGMYNDPKGGNFRNLTYPRLAYHFQFTNAFFLFPEVHDQTIFSINIYRAHARDIRRFSHIANLFLPQTVDACMEHHGHGPVPGIKDDEHNWNIHGHRARVIEVGPTELALFARLYDDEGTPPLQARLPALHSTQLVAVLEKFARQPQRLGDLKDEYYATVMFDETNAVKKDGTIRRETRFPTDASEWILSGPHFFVGTPFNKTPREVCNHNQAYDCLDLTDLPDDYLPRTNYVPDCTPEEYRSRTPRVGWGVEKPVTEFYRVISRTMLSQSGERTLITAISPPKTGHLDLGFSLTFKNNKQLTPYITALFNSVPYDFMVKSTGKGHFRQDVANQMKIPTPPKSQLGTSLRIRGLLLNCLTTHYADLWQECFDSAFTDDAFAKDDPRLDNAHFKHLTPTWTRDVALRTDYARRQALVEIDVLAAMALGLTLEELQTIYRVQFPVMRMYEDDTWYDQKGRIVFTNSRGLVGVGLPRSKSASWPDGPYWQDVQHMSEGTVTQTIQDDTLPGGVREKTIVYEAPFTRCDREKDYAEVWGVFEERFGHPERDNAPVKDESVDA